MPIAYELLRFRTRDAGDTTVYVTRHPLEGTTVRVRVLPPNPSSSIDGAPANREPEAIVAGFFLREPDRPLGEVVTGGRRLAHEPVAEPGVARACVHVDGTVRLARRSELPSEPGATWSRPARCSCPTAGRSWTATTTSRASRPARGSSTPTSPGAPPAMRARPDRRRAPRVCCDGRRTGVDAGLGLDELARLLISLGARDAINLDGGGSATLIHYGHLLNRPYSSVDQPAPDPAPS